MRTPVRAPDAAEVSEPRGPRARCGLGFSCALMMQMPGLDPGACENYEACGAAQGYPVGARFDLARAGADGSRETWQVDRTAAAVGMLMMRGAPQTLASFGLPGLLEDLAQAVATLREALLQVRGYIAPGGAVVVGEQRGGRTRLRLVATERIFDAARGGGPVRAIHLGGEGDERAHQARAGIERRQRLDDAHRLAAAAAQALQNAAALLDTPIDQALIDQADEVGDGRPIHDREDRGRIDQGDDDDPDFDLDDGGEAMLMARGAHQQPGGTPLAQQLQQVQALTTHLQEALQRFAPPDTFIAAAACEAHRYNVKRPGAERDGNGQSRAVLRVYWYNKLTSRQTIFAPAHEPQPVKVIHLSKDDDPRNIEGRRGIERRNRLRRTAARLRSATTALELARASLQGV